MNRNLLMKIYIIISVLFCSIGFGQTKDRVGFIDTEYIIKKQPEYQEAEKELKKRAAIWDKTIDQKKREIQKAKNELAVERPLLTSNLIKEREEDIQILEKELRNFQQEKFGVDGDYFVAKNNLIKPIQDQINQIVQQIIEEKKYSAVFDKSDKDQALLYTNNKYDITDRVIYLLERERKKQRLDEEGIAKIEEREKLDEQIEREKSRREKMEEVQDRIKKQKEKEGFSDADERTNKIKEQQEKRKREYEKRLAEREKQRKEQIEKRKAQIKAQQEAREKRKKELEEKKKEMQKLREEKLKEQQRKREEQRKEIQRKREEQLKERKRKLEERKKQIEEAKNKNQLNK